MKYSAEFEILRENFQTLRGFIFGGGFVFNNHENVVGFHALRCTMTEIKVLLVPFA